MLTRFKLLPLGYYRLLIVLMALLYIVCASFVGVSLDSSGFYYDKQPFKYSAMVLLWPLLAIGIFLLIIRAVLWVADGFKKPE
jgi:hypothetical protein